MVGFIPYGLKSQVKAEVFRLLCSSCVIFIPFLYSWTWTAGCSDSQRHVTACHILSLTLLVSPRKSLGTCKCQPSDSSLFPVMAPYEMRAENDEGNKCFCRGSFHSCSASWLLPCPFSIKHTNKIKPLTLCSQERLGNRRLSSSLSSARTLSLRASNGIFGLGFYDVRDH